MSIGLIDLDALMFPKTFRPNLEIMKLSAYYKSKGKIVRLLLDLTKMEIYEKIYVRKNIYSDDFMEEIYLLDNVEYGGYAFTNNIYVPLPKEIENTLPDPSIYDNYIKLYKDKMKKRHFEGIVNIMLRSSNIRLSTNSKEVNTNYQKFIIHNRLKDFVHDTNLYNISGAKEAIEDIAQYGRSISCVNPIHITERREDTDWWASFPQWDGKTRIIFDYKVSNNEFIKYSRMGKTDTRYFLMGNNDLSMDSFICNFRTELSRILYCKIYNIRVYFIRNPNISNYKFIYMYNSIIKFGRYSKKISYFDYAKSSKKLGKRVMQLERKYPELYDVLHVRPEDVIKNNGSWRLL